MSDVVNHPTPQDLAAFRLCILPERVAATVAAHLGSCPACRKAVANVPPDALLGNAPISPGRPPMPPATCPAIPPELVHHPKYTILRELGRGGMGVVYQARQTMMNRQVVIKVIYRSLLDQPGTLERFRREVQAAAQLSHPNIVTAYDAEQAGELHMLVMEFVPGQSLVEVLQKRGPLPVINACHYMRQVALGLQHAHERDMIHRDIKPSNLILMPKSQVKILDFGLAKIVRESATSKGLTPSDEFIGTPEYCAPEQTTDARSADIRADLYSLGCTLYFLLAGRPPFQEDTSIKTILAHLQKPPQPLPELRPDVPMRLWEVVARLLAKEPGQRYQTPIEVAHALAPFVKPSAKPDAKDGPPPALDVHSTSKGWHDSSPYVRMPMLYFPCPYPLLHEPVNYLVLDKDPANQLEALKSLAKLGVNGKPAYWLLLKRGEVAATVEVVGGLGTIGDLKIGVELIRTLAAIAPNEEPVVTALIRCLVYSKKEAAKLAAAEGLARTTTFKKEAAEALIISLQRDPLDNVRAAAAKALGELGPDAKEAVKALEGAGTDASAKVRAQAKTALQKIKKD